MKLILKILLIAALTYAGGFVLPWWIVILISFLICFLLDSSGISSFVSGFLGGGIVWLFYSWYIDAQTESIMSSKIIQLFPFGDRIILIILAGLIGAFSGGFGALSGNSFKLLFKKKKAESFYS